MKGCYTMGLTTIIFNSESEFRKYIILNAKYVAQIFVFEDELDHVIFFYCITKNHLIVATKEPSSKNFFSYKENYEKLAEKLKLKATPISNQPYAIKIEQSGE